MAHTLAQARAWNSTLKTARPELTALFVGGTSGIGRSTAVRLADSIAKPTIYIVGRNEKAGAEVLEEMKAANENGSYHFIPADVSDLRTVDKVCQDLKSKVKALDLLFLSSGGVTFSKQETDDKIDIYHILRYYSRMRFVYNLLPTLEAANSPRVVSILAGGQEIKIEEDNLDLQKEFSFSASLGYPTSMTSLAFETLASEHPSVSFLHVFPGVVATPLFSKTLGSILGTIVSFLAKPFIISMADSGEWQTYLATSAEYPSKKDSTDASAAGYYILNHDGKDSTNKALMEELREKGFPAIVWKHTLDTFDRICN
ncbi:short-chain dehydrogenases/reductase [Penicillium maclennaniae]|uniref:short-chain dehydrogenases/reductase n=1 Tax=Penicillium maclennaniae TaxID=1343394 RepID=UPI002540E441|nr:short-chain dehydrogenases/reductase [Penicillium maclennaniae]KAJ5677213.1 short-chain dehydrogenases/reductase [Penicillium maclennaniae]